jgi:hypothetical protein
VSAAEMLIVVSTVLILGNFHPNFSVIIYNIGGYQPFTSLLHYLELHFTCTRKFNRPTPLQISTPPRTEIIHNFIDAILRSPPRPAKVAENILFADLQIQDPPHRTPEIQFPVLRVGTFDS